MIVGGKSPILGGSITIDRGGVCEDQLDDSLHDYWVVRYLRLISMMNRRWYFRAMRLCLRF